MTTYSFGTRTVGEIVADDFRTAEVFKKAGIDFCCGGGIGLKETCQTRGIDQTALEEELRQVAVQPLSQALNFKEWDLAFLCDYIVNTHHAFVKKNLPDLLFYTEKIASVHGDNHAELKTIAHLFAEINRELLQHLQNEEEVLFPAVRRMVANPSAADASIIASEIARMTGEHEFAGGAMDQINGISHHYQVPADGCNTYAVTYRLLEQFEDDLHVHVHLENNILFPKAVSLSVPA